MNSIKEFTIIIKKNEFLLCMLWMWVLYFNRNCINVVWYFVSKPDLPFLLALSVKVAKFKDIVWIKQSRVLEPYNILCQGFYPEGSLLITLVCWYVGLSVVFQSMNISKQLSSVFLMFGLNLGHHRGTKVILLLISLEIVMNQSLLIC